MKILIIFILFLFFAALINSRSPRRRRYTWCKYGYHYRIVKNGANRFEKFHACICPKLKCKKIKKCKFGVPYVENYSGCKECPKCRNYACPKLTPEKDCLKYRKYKSSGCEYQTCIKYKCPKLKCKKLKCSLGTEIKKNWKGCDMCPQCKCKRLNCPRYGWWWRRRRCKFGSFTPLVNKEGCATGCNQCRKKACKDLKCKPCKYGVEKWNDKFDKERCPTACHQCKKKPKNCPKLKCKKLKCSLGTVTYTNWKGCDMCPRCKCPVNNWNLKCKFGQPYGKTNKEGCYVYKCRKKACPKKEQPKKKCDSLWWSWEKGCETKPHCWMNPCKKYEKCPKLKCTYGVFRPRDPKTYCNKCAYCEKDPRIAQIEKLMKEHHHKFVQLLFKLKALKESKKKNNFKVFEHLRRRGGYMKKYKMKKSKSKSKKHDKKVSKKLPKKLKIQKKVQKIQKKFKIPKKFKKVMKKIAFDMNITLEELVDMVIKYFDLKITF